VGHVCQFCAFCKSLKLLIDSGLACFKFLIVSSPQVGGKKELTGRTDIEIEISNQCARLIANAIIYYNSAILPRLVAKYEASGNTKALALIKKMSPAVWRHIHLNGHYTFRSDGQVIDLDAIIAGLEVG